MLLKSRRGELEARSRIQPGAEISRGDAHFYPRSLYPPPIIRFLSHHYSEVSK